MISRFSIVVRIGLIVEALSRPASFHSITTTSPILGWVTSYSHQDNVWSSSVVFIRTHDYRGTLFCCRLIGERKWDKDYITEVIGYRIRHRWDCPISSRRRVQRSSMRPEPMPDHGDEQVSP